MINIIGKRRWFYLLSSLIIVPGLIALLLWGLNLSIDFTGGSLLDLRFDQPNKPLVAGDVRAEIETLGYTGSTVQISDDDTALIRVRQINNDQKNEIIAALADEYGVQPTEQRFEAVGPSVGNEVTRGAIFAVIAATVGILLYLAFAFRDVEHPFRYGVVTIMAMLHDVLIVLGVAAIMGHFFGWEVDSLFLTALLTVIGFSVHDSIVVFDRVRENLHTMRGLSFAEIVNHSTVQTLDRSINTQLTALFTLLAVYLFGGETIRQFVFWLIVGLIAGTYSSIFNAAPLLVSWTEGAFGKLLDRNGTKAATT
ncbi:MAG: protein translocase subunit SecF [Ardenticatenales bacterium]|nr:protein translocase subunit SecF [Ardenticatenales bacterium]MCB9172029.1 protein translocase subunit SecF [Ardenticatenales bacterium]